MFMNFQVFLSSKFQLKIKNYTQSTNFSLYLSIKTRNDFDVIVKFENQLKF